MRFRISHGTANSAHCTSPAALPWSNLLVINTVRFVISMLQRLLDTKAWMLAVLRRHAYSIGPDANFIQWALHTAMSEILYWYAPARSKRPVGETLHSHRGIETNPANRSRIGSKSGWYGKVNQKSGRVANVPFHSHMNKKGKSSSGPLSGPAGFLRVHASAFHLLSPSILKKLSFPAEVPVSFYF